MSPKVLGADFDQKIGLETIPRVESRHGTRERGAIPESVPWVDLSTLDISDDVKRKITNPEWRAYKSTSEPLFGVICQLIRA